MDRGDNCLVLPACLAPLPYLHARQGGCVYMAVPRQEGLVTEAGACAQVRAALQTIPVPALTTPTLEVSGRLPPQGLHGHLRVCPLQDQPPAIQVSAVAEGAEGFLEGTRETSL